MYLHAVENAVDIPVQYQVKYVGQLVTNCRKLRCK